MLTEELTPEQMIEPCQPAVPGLAPAQRLRRGLAAARASLKPSLVATVSTSFAIFGLTALQGVLLARLLGPEARGEYGTAVFYTQTLTYMGLLGAQFVVARRAAREAAGRLELSRSVIRFGVLTGLGTMLAVAVLAFTTLPPEKQLLAPLCLLCALALPLEQIRLLLLAVDQGSGKFRRYNFVQLVTSTIFPLVLFAVWMLGGCSVATAAVLTLVPPAAGLALRLTLQGPRSLLSGPASPSARTLVKEGRPFLLSAVISDLYGRLDAFLFLWLASFTAQGLYAAAVPAATLLTVGPDALALFSFNAASGHGAPAGFRRLLRDGALVAGFQVVMAGSLALVIGPLIVLVYGNRFAGAIPFALALLPASAAAGFAKVAEGHLRGRGKVKVGIWARLLAAALMVATVWLSFGRLQEMAIPLAASLAHGFVALVLAWFVLADARREARGLTIPPAEDVL